MIFSDSIKCTCCRNHWNKKDFVLDILFKVFKERNNFPLTAQSYADIVRVDPLAESLWIDQTENLSGVFLHRSIRMDIFISDQIGAQQRKLVDYLQDENLRCIERPLKALNGADIVLSHTSALILRRDSELEITSSLEPTGQAFFTYRTKELQFELSQFEPKMSRNFLMW